MTRIPIWRWVLGTYLIIVVWIFGSAFVQSALYRLQHALDIPTSTGLSLAMSLAGFLPFFIITPLMWVTVLKQPLPNFISRDGRPRVRRIGRGFLVWLVLSAATSAIDYSFFSRNAYQLSFDIQRLLPILLVTVLLLPVQTSAEEFFFRGWLLHWSANRSIVFQVLLGGFMFAWPHLGNPEAQGNELYGLISWFILGAGWSYTTARDRSIEIALGAHFANNFFALFLVGYENSALPTESIVSTTAINMQGTAIALAITIPLFAIITGRRRTRVRS